MSMEDKLYLYAAREIESGNLVSDITNPRRKYWDREANAKAAINSYNNHVNYYGRMNYFVWRQLHRMSKI